MIAIRSMITKIYIQDQETETSALKHVSWTFDDLIRWST